MPLTQLTLTNFRNFIKSTLALNAGFIVLTGENGAGKTNILEAVSMLAPGRGLRGVALNEMARSSGPGDWTVAATLSAPPLTGAAGEQSTIKIPSPNPAHMQEGDITLGSGTLASASDRRIVRINGATASANMLSEWLSIIWLTPAMDRLFTDTASERRRFLDRLTLAVDPTHAHHATRYEAAMRQRNRLLGEDEVADAQWLTALEHQMAEHGLAITAARWRLVSALVERLADAPDGPFARASIALTGWEANDMGHFSDALLNGRARDAAAGRTLTGPHRTDLVVTHVAKQQPAARCSTGEQKALLLGILLGHTDLVAARTCRRPVFLLDEVAAHLDPLRRTALFDRLAAGGGQVWMTGTEPTLFDAVRSNASWFTINEGSVSQI